MYGFTHAEVHSLITKAENNLTLTITRNDNDDDKKLQIIEKDILSEIKKEIEIDEQTPSNVQFFFLL